MNQLDVHLLLNHFPIVMVLVAAGLLLVGLIRNNITLKKTALILTIISTILVIPVFLTGEGAEEIAEELPGVTHELIHEHEELGEKAYYGMIALGVFSIAALVLLRKRADLAKIMLWVVLLSSVVLFVVMMQTSHTGGEIRHTEIRG